MKVPQEESSSSSLSQGVSNDPTFNPNVKTPSETPQDLQPQTRSSWVVSTLKTIGQTIHDAIISSPGP